MVGSSIEAMLKFCFQDGTKIKSHKKFHMYRELIPLLNSKDTHASGYQMETHSDENQRGNYKEGVFMKKEQEMFTPYPFTMRVILFETGDFLKQYQV
ncbi:hypothetical protein C5167_018861 [Papaver somniferum]|uniref:Uncharacterized protein n=1 Tax=Papaver somniferum TaxID=3469 RepID=A0A4Y7ISL9_PAPSO|nr:hypothetical protein C5167_018861 [Papaver somniferum]